MNKKEIKKFITENNFVSLDECIIEDFKTNKDFARICLEEDMKEYLNTGDPCYLKNTLKQCLQAFGFCNFEKLSGISRKTLYNIVGGTHRPKLENILKIINFLGYEINLTTIKH